MALIDWRLFACNGYMHALRKATQELTRVECSQNLQIKLTLICLQAELANSPSMICLACLLINKIKNETGIPQPEDSPHFTNSSVLSAVHQFHSLLLLAMHPPNCPKTFNLNVINTSFNSFSIWLYSKIIIRSN